MLGRVMAVAALVVSLAGPVMAGGIGFDLPNLTWPEGPVFGTKGGKP